MMMAADGVNMAMMSDDEMKAHTDRMASMTDEQKTEEMKKTLREHDEDGNSL